MMRTFFIFHIFIKIKGGVTLIKSFVIMDSVYMELLHVMEVMTVEITVMKKDVVYGKYDVCCAYTAKHLFTTVGSP